MDSPRCACGHDRDHKLVKRDGRYTLWGYFLLVMGSTPVPKEIEYVCRQCGQSLGKTTDPAELAKSVK